MTVSDSIYQAPAPRIRTLADGRLQLAAPAKINLNLLVGQARADGFHPLDSYVAKLTLHDTITLSPRDDGCIRLTCSGARCGPEEKNLAVLAAKAIRDGRDLGVDIDLVKRIAPGKGLGGGSSDAASVLFGLNILWQIDMAANELAELAASLGSDVPLFLGPPAARMTGRGERIEPVDICDFWAVLCLPDGQCATGEVYRAFDESPVEMADQLDPAVLTHRPSAWRSSLQNQLTSGAQRICPELCGLQEEISRLTSLPVHVTGSGSCMFILCDSLAEANEALSRVSPVDCRFIITSTNPW